MPVCARGTTRLPVVLGKADFSSAEYVSSSHKVIQKKTLAC